jgi:hypothetical protein
VHACLLPRLSWSWPVLLPSDTHIKPITSTTAVLLPIVTYLLALPPIYIGCFNSKKSLCILSTRHIYVLRVNLSMHREYFLLCFVEETYRVFYELNDLMSRFSTINTAAYCNMNFLCLPGDSLSVMSDWLFLRKVMKAVPVTGREAHRVLRGRGSHIF